MAKELGKSRSTVHRRYFLVVLCIIFLAVITLKDEVSMYGSPYFLELQQQYYTQDVSSRLQSKEDRYNILALLEEGHWEHTYALPNQNDTVQNPLNEMIQKTYLPIEIDWLRGKNLPDKGWRQKFRMSADYDDGLMYQSALGNQFGACLQPDFQPSMSRWVSKNSGHQPQPTSSPDITSPTLQLILSLAKANATMCLVGDSVDFQFYDALRHNLHRQNQLQSDIKLNITNKHDVPVNYTSETGKPPRDGWMTMNHFEETLVTLSDDTDNSTTYTTIIRYFKMYGWSPWNVPFMEGCNVLVLNLGLHYDAHNAGMTGTHWGSPKFEDDFHAAIAYMLDFIVSHQGTAVWR